MPGWLDCSLVLQWQCFDWIISYGMPICPVQDTCHAGRLIAAVVIHSLPSVLPRVCIRGRISCAGFSQRVGYWAVAVMVGAQLSVKYVEQLCSNIAAAVCQQLCVGLGRCVPFERPSEARGA